MNQVAQQVLARISKTNPAVLLEIEYILVTGNKLFQTFGFLKVVGFSAKLLVLAASMGEMVPISGDQMKYLRKAFIKNDV